mmetsp:Transcript_35248/g.92347  ORF Transcript_35248/g.92347 Transcript_35248/m.92347 type:complete len:225 (-) Transcript_35248:998-1672(-)
MVIPRSPISVASPAGNCLMSSFRQQASKTWSYHSSSMSDPNKMFSLMVSLRICGLWVTYASLPPSCTSPLTLDTSPSRPPAQELFPEPTRPQTATICPGLACMLTFLRVAWLGLSPSLAVDHRKSAFSHLTVPAGTASLACGSKSSSLISSNCILCTFTRSWRMVFNMWGKMLVPTLRNSKRPTHMKTSAGSSWPPRATCTMKVTTVPTVGIPNPKDCCPDCHK